MTRALRSLVLTCTLLVHPVSRADTVADWTRIALDTIVQSEPRLEYQLRAMTMVHVAMFETLNFIGGRYIPHFIVRSAELNGISLEAAAAAAAHHVLVHLYPHQRAALAAALENSFHALPDHQTIASGVTTGMSIAAVICAVRAPAERTNEPSLDQRQMPPTLEPWLRNGVNQFRSGESLAAQDRGEGRDGNDTNASGVHVSAAHANAQGEIDRVWRLPSPLSWNLLLAELIAIRGLSPIDSARIHALASMTIADVYGATRHVQSPCAPCGAAAAMAVILESEFGAGGNESETVKIDQKSGRQTGRYALQHYFRPLSELDEYPINTPAGAPLAARPREGVPRRPSD